MLLSKVECAILRKVCACGYGEYEEMKERVERYKERRIVLPWSGESEGCKSLKYNMGLYTQRGGEVLLGGEYCVGCVKECEKKGEHRYGTVEERKAVGILEYKDGRGKGVVRYTEIMKKLNLTREEVLEEGKRRGVKVAECHFEEKSVKRGRPKKEKEKVNEKKKRGRPRKEKEMVSNKAGEDLIASLLNENKREDGMCIGEPNAKSVCDKEATKATPTSGCDIGDPKAKEVREKPSANKTETKATPTSGCEKPSADKAETKAIPTSGCEKPSADKADEEEEEEEETVVIKYEIDGITYLKSEDNVLYDMKTHDCVGIWNELTKKIDEIPDEDEDD
jgi:hypothetical protein